MSNLTPLRAVRAKCLSCQGAMDEPFETIDGKQHKPYRPFKEVEECETTHCALHSFRLGKYASGTSEKDVLRAIRAFCWDCLAGRGDRTYQGGRWHNRARPTSLTKLCEVSDCVLFGPRTGRNAQRTKRGVR